MTFHDTLPDILPLLQASDVTVLPYSPGDHITGGARLKGLEYLACGKVLISTPGGTEGLKGLVPNIHYLIAQDLSEFLDCLIRVLAHPQEYRAMGEEGRRFVPRHYSWDAVMEDYLAFIESLIGDHSG